MIDYINMRCNQWAHWCRLRDAGALGFPRECSYTRLEARGGKGFNQQFDEQAWDVHQAVNALDEQLKLAVLVFYLRRGTVDDKARDCHCHRDTLFVRIHRAHVKILEWLNDDAAGVPHETKAVKRACKPPTVSV